MGTAFSWHQFAGSKTGQSNGSFFQFFQKIDFVPSQIRISFSSSPPLAGRNVSSPVLNAAQDRTISR